MTEVHDTSAPGRVRPNRRLRRVLVSLLLLLVTVRLLIPAVRDENYGIVADARMGGWTSDFAAILTFAKAFWRGNATYDIESYRRVTAERFGRPLERALPFPYSPTMLWILGPLCILPTAWAYVVWSLLSIVAAWWMIAFSGAIWLAAALFSPTAFSCFKAGQTALLTTTGLLFIMSPDIGFFGSTGAVKRGSRAWIEVAILWALTAKPPLALTAGIVLLQQRRWRVVGMALALSLLSSAILTPQLGRAWMGEYLHMVTHYDLDTADPTYVGSLVPETMSNLRALLHVVFGVRDATASGLSSLLWLLALVGILTAGMHQRLASEAAWGFGVLAYLLLCPHVTSTEELHVILVLALLTQPAPTIGRAIRWTGILSTLAMLSLAPGLGVPVMIRLPAAFAGKLFLVGLVWAQWVRSPGRTAGRLAAATTG